MKEVRRILPTLWTEVTLQTSSSLKQSANRFHGKWMSTVTQIKHVDHAATEESIKSYDEIPRVPSVPLLGSTWAYLPVIGKYKLRELNLAYDMKYREYGNIVREDFSKDIRTVLLFDVQDFEKYFRREGRDADRILFDTIRMYREARPERFLGGGLVATNGSQWYAMRSKVQPHLLRPKEIHNYLPGIDGIAQEFLILLSKRMNENSEIEDFRKELTHWGIESIGYIGLDTRLGALSNSKESQTLLEAGDQLFDIFHKLEFGFNHMWRIFPTPTYRRFVKVMDMFSDLAMRLIKEAAKRLEENEDPDHQLTLLEQFLVKEKLDPRLANTMIMDMLLAGVDTTSSTFLFLLYHLARNPDKQEKAYQEVKRVMESSNGQVTSSILNEIRYLKSCIKESMRLTPTVASFPRTLKEEAIVSGYRVPPGVMLMFCMGVASRLEENFKNSQEYRPERWMEKKDHNPFTFMPFGFGVRSCIGRRIAEMELQTLLMRVLQTYRVEYHYEDLECITKLVTVPKRPLKFKFIRR